MNPPLTHNIRWIVAGVTEKSVAVIRATSRVRLAATYGAAVILVVQMAEAFPVAGVDWRYALAAAPMTLTPALRVIRMGRGRVMTQVGHEGQRVMTQVGHEGQRVMTHPGHEGHGRVTRVMTQVGHEGHDPVMTTVTVIRRTVTGSPEDVARVMARVMRSHRILSVTRPRKLADGRTRVTVSFAADPEETS